MTEHAYIRSIHYHLKKLEMHSIDVWKINDAFKGGCADAIYDGPAKDLWVEYKFIIPPKRSSTRCIPALSEQQNFWLTNRYNNHRNIAVIVGSIIGCHIFTSPDQWNTGITDFRSNTLSNKEIATAIHAFITNGDPLPSVE